MQVLTVTSKHDSASQATDYSPELGLQLLQTNKDEQAEEEYRLLSAKFRRWPYKFCQLWLILGFVIALAAEVFILKTLWDSTGKTLTFEQVILYAGLIVPQIGLLLSLYGCGQMLYAIKERKFKIAQLGFSKLQYSMIISPLEVCLFIWSMGFERFFSSPYGWPAVLAMVFNPGSNLVAGFAVMRVFRECDKGARENKCDASQVSEETDSHIKDFLKQNEVLQEEISKYDEQLNRFGVKVYRCWLRLVVIFEMVRTLVFYLYASEQSNNGPWRNSAMIGLFLSSFLCIYSCFKMGNAIVKKIAKSSERAILVLKVCLAVSLISYLLILKWGIWTTGTDGEDESLGNLVLLNLWLFGYCCFVSVVTLLGGMKVHKILKERDDYAKFYSMPNFSSSNL